MLRIVSNFSKQVFKPLNTSIHSLKFWIKSNDSSKSVVKSGGKVSLAYYSLDPYYLSTNKGNPIIIYHSLLMSKEMYANSVQQLAKESGRAVYLLDMRNHGESPHSPLQESNLNQMAKDVIDFMDEMSLKKAVLIGHGFGSVVMLQTSILFNERVEKVVAIDIMPIDLPQISVKLMDRMMIAVKTLPQYISVLNARLIINRLLKRYFKDKILLNCILINLIPDSNGYIKWRFNLPVIRQMVVEGIQRSVNSEGEFDGPVLIMNGRYGVITANIYSHLKQLFPNSKFDFYRRYRLINDTKQKHFVTLLTNFIGKHQNLN